MINHLLKKVKDIYTDGSISVILNTHRTMPDNHKDPIVLKNLIKEAEDRLLKSHDKDFAKPLIVKLNKIAASIDHSLNLESLVIYVNSNLAEYTRLPVEVRDRVIINHTFATRDLVRAMHQETGYYVLVLSRQQARLIEAFNDKVIQEFEGLFPVKNTIFTADKLKQSMPGGQDILTEEFFKQVNKILWETIQENPLPILLATETRNFSHYRKIADKRETIIGHIKRNRDEEKPHHIVADAWKVVKTHVKQKYAARIAEIENAVSSEKFLFMLTDIWKALGEGRGQTLFVKKGFFQPALVADGKITLVDNNENNLQGYVDDIIDEMIEVTLFRGGDVVFVERNETSFTHDVALITRY